MQIVIDILDDTYGHLTSKEARKMTNKDAEAWFFILHKAIFVNGKVLPKGHGRLIDAEDVDNHIIGHVDLRCCPTIIEADKEGNNADSN